MYVCVFVCQCVHAHRKGRKREREIKWQRLIDYKELAHTMNGGWEVLPPAVGQLETQDTWRCSSNLKVSRLKTQEEPVFQFDSSSVQFSSVAQSCLTLCNPMNRSTPGLPVHHRRLLKLTSIESVMPSSHLILCRPLLLLPPIPPRMRVFSSESTFRMRWPKHRSFSLHISPSDKHQGLISFRMDWLDLLAV